MRLACRKLKLRRSLLPQPRGGGGARPRFSSSAPSRAPSIVRDGGIVAAFDDNYIYVGDCGDGGFLVDPADPVAALGAARALGLDVVAVLTTHKHEDHTAGNADIVRACPGVPVYGPRECDEEVHAVTHFVGEGDVIEIGRTRFTVLDTPYHTSGHVSYFAEQERATPALFCGDALFIGGCGRFFEGDGAGMVAAFDKMLQLPSETQIFCGHEYTLSNYEFALSVDPGNDYLVEQVERAKALRAQGLPTVPSTIGDEQSANPFARLNHRAIRMAVKPPDGATEAEMADLLRAMKNNF
jgi:hydroxyacylglutathione hydrolase